MKRGPKKKKPKALTDNWVEPSDGARFRRLFKRAAQPVAYATVKAAERGESVLGAIMSAFTREAWAMMAEEEYNWVKEKRGRKVVLEWNEFGGLHTRRVEPDGTEA